MGDCDVCLSMGDGDCSATFYNTKLVKARKPHRCEECDLPILVGQLYHYTSGMWDGDFSTFHECCLCYQIREVFSCGEGWMHGGLWESMQEYVFPNLKTSSPCFAKLTPIAKQFVLDQWNKWKGLRK